MTGKTLDIIKSGIPHEGLMRIVTGDAGDARVGAAPASTLRQTVGLESDVEGGEVSCRGHIQQRTMTGATKIYKLYWSEGCRVKNCVTPGLELPGSHLLDMAGSRAMARLTGNSGRGVIRVELPPHRGSGGVTGKALLSGL